MKKIVLFLLTILFCGALFAQPGNWQARGTRDKYEGIAAKKVLLIPTGCGAPSALLSKDSLEKQGALFADTCNNRLYFFNSKTLVWDSVHVGVAAAGSGGGSGNFNAGSYYRILNPGTQAMKTIQPAFGVSIDSATDYLTFEADTAALSTKANVQKLHEILDAKKLETADSGLVKTGVTITPDDRMATVAQIGNYTGKSRLLTVEDTLRGGMFIRYTGTDAVDNGMIFSDALGRKWLRKNIDGRINVAWYGAKSDNAIDCSPLFEAARDYYYKHPNTCQEFIIPFSANAAANNRYIFTRELKFTQPINIVGTGINKPLLYFPGNMRGVFFQQFDLDFFSTVKNIRVEQGWLPAAERDSTRAAITVRCRMDMYYTDVLFSTGPCLEVAAVSGGDSTTNPLVGQASFAMFTHCFFGEGLFGVKIEGNEANSMTFLNCEFRSNRRWGVYDNGFLSSRFINCGYQGNSNSSIAGAKTTVLYGGKYYAATALHDDGTGIGKRPDLYPAYWIETGPRAWTAWDTTAHYWSGGSYYIKDANGAGGQIFPYVESDDGPYEINPKSLSIGGVDGVGVGTGKRIAATVDGIALIGSVYLPETNNANTINSFRVNVNSPDYTTVAHFKNKNGTPYSLAVEGYNTIAAQRFKNSGGVHGEFDYIGTDFQWYSGATLAATLNTTSLVPGANNTSDLGSTGTRWKDVYAATYTGSGAGLTSIPQSAVTGLPADLLSIFKKSATYSVVATDANITAAPGTVYHLPAATISANRTINVSAISTENDYIEILNNEAGFTWSFTGATVYFVDRTTTVTNLVTDAHYKIRLINGKLIIL